MRITDFNADAVTSQVRNAMLEESNVLRIAEFYEMVGNADNTRKKSAASGGRFRDLNADYPDNQVDPTFATPVLKIFGDKVQTDRAHERRGSDLASVRASDLIEFARNLGKEFQNYFINGDTAVDTKQFNGLKKIIPAGQKITPATNGITVPLGNSDTNKAAQQAFLEELDNLVMAIDKGAGALMMDGKTLSRLTAIAREQVQFSRDQFGELIASYNMVPVLIAGIDKSGNKIIPHTETVGTSTDCTSVYGFRFGEKADLSFATNIALEVKDLGLVGVHYTYSVDFDLDLVLLNDKSVARLEGIRII